MSKIIGVTVGTPTSPDKIREIVGGGGSGGGVTEEQIAAAVESYLEKNPVEVPDVEIPTALPNPNALTFTGAVSASYDGSKPISVAIPDTYSKSQIDALMGSYITDIDNLVGGEG